MPTSFHAAGASPLRQTAAMAPWIRAVAPSPPFCKRIAANIYIYIISRCLGPGECLHSFIHIYYKPQLMMLLSLSKGAHEWPSNKKV